MVHQPSATTICPTTTQHPLFRFSNIVNMPGEINLHKSVVCNVLLGGGVSVDAQLADNEIRQVFDIDKESGFWGNLTVQFLRLMSRMRSTLKVLCGYFNGLMQTVNFLYWRKLIAFLSRDHGTTRRILNEYCWVCFSLALNFEVFLMIWVSKWKIFLVLISL